MTSSFAFLPGQAGDDEDGELVHVPGVPRSEGSRVSWTPEADADLQRVVNDPAVRDQLKRNGDATLHEIEVSVGGDRRGEGFEGEVMWHRGWTHEQELRASWLPEPPHDGPWNYVLFFRKSAGLTEFEVLAVRNRMQIADRIWEQMQNKS